MTKELRFSFPETSPIRKPSGYCVHKYDFSDSGLLTKLELFAYFPMKILPEVLAIIHKFPEAKKGTYPPYFCCRGKHLVLIDKVILWNKAPRKIKCYKQEGDVFKLEVTAGTLKGHGKKYLEPKATLNSLGTLIKRVTADYTPISDKSHSEFFFISEFLNICEDVFLKKGLSGQIKAFKKQKLRTDIKWG